MPDSPARHARPECCADRRDWRLLPAVSDRQLVTVVGFIAVPAFISITLVTYTLLLRTPLGHAWPVIVAAAGLGSVAACGLVGLLALVLLRWRNRSHKRNRTKKSQHRSAPPPSTTASLFERSAS